MRVLGPGWGWTNAQNGQVRVWWNAAVHPEDEGNAHKFADAIDSTIWPRLSTAFATRLPPSDADEANNGGDGRLDIALVDIPKSQAVPYKEVCPTPVFVLLRRSASLAALAHEMMHAFEFSYAMARGCTSYGWLMEATANWAMDFVYPASQEERLTSQAFLSHPEESLETLGEEHEYGAYLLPFFLTCSSGPCDPANRPTYSPYVQVTWDNTEQYDSLAGLRERGCARASGPVLRDEARQTGARPGREVHHRDAGDCGRAEGGHRDHGPSVGEDRNPCVQTREVARCPPHDVEAVSVVRLPVQGLDAEGGLRRAGSLYLTLRKRGLSAAGAEEPSRSGDTVTGADSGEVTALLLQWNEGQEDARERLVALVYPELRRLASRSLHSGRGDQTLQPTALVHEVYQKLVDQRKVRWQNRAHFYAIASELMRRIVVGHARHRHALRRGGFGERVPLSEEMVGTALGPDVDLIALDDALNELATLDKELARVVELRFFGGLNVEEAADVLGVSGSTVKRDWSMARAWLHRRLSST